MSKYASNPLLSIVTLSLLAALLAGCGGGGGSPADPAPAGPEPIRVVATTGMVGDVARRVAGDHVEVQAEILAKMARGKRVVAVAEEVSEERLLSPPEFEGAHDPHIWFDVDLWSQVVAPVVTALSEVDPAHAADYQANGDALRAELLELDGWVTEQVAQLPEDQRVLVTAHDAFGYFGARYGFEVVGLQGLSTATEAGLKDMDRVVGVVVERKLGAIFVESSVPAKSIEAVQSACADKGHTVALGGELFSDAMGADGTPEGTYVGMVRHNVETVVGALQ